MIIHTKKIIFFTQDFLKIAGKKSLFHSSCGLAERALDLGTL
jgi:hypothetical protein